VRVKPLLVHVTRALPVLAAVGLVVPLQTASASSPFAISHLTLTAPANVGAGSGVELTARLNVHGAPLPAQTVHFVSRPVGARIWRDLGAVATDMTGTAGYQIGSVNRPTQFGAYSDGVAGIAAARTATTVVHVVSVRAAAPGRVGYRSAARLRGQLLLDGHGLPAQRLHFMIRRDAQHAWRTARWARADAAGWARVSARPTRTFQLGVRFEGTPNLAPSPLAVTTVRVAPRPRPAHRIAFRFPLRDVTHVAPVGTWSQDQGVDLMAAGEACGHAAILVAVGNGVVVQEGINGFGPTAPVIRMTSGPFRGRDVYYGHTGRDFVRVGDHVRIGQRISEIGCGIVGQSSAPHLEIGVGVPGGPTCCPAMHETSGEMWHQLVSSLSAAS